MHTYMSRYHYVYMYTHAHTCTHICTHTHICLDNIMYTYTQRLHTIQRAPHRIYTHMHTYTPTNHTHIRTHTHTNCTHIRCTIRTHTHSGLGAQGPGRVGISQLRACLCAPSLITSVCNVCAMCVW